MTDTPQKRDRPLKKIAEGREAEMFEWEDGKVLRLARGPDPEAAAAWQMATLEQAAAAGMRVPHVYGRLSVNGRPGFIMERLDGTDLLTAIARSPWKLLSAAGLCARVHARMHGLASPPETPPLKERVRRALASDAVPPDVRERALSELDSLPGGDRLCHGDFHPGNVMMKDGEPVVIDWSNVAGGEPAADVARTWVVSRFGALPPGSGPALRTLAALARKIMLDAYMRAYRRQRSLDTATFQRWQVVRAADRLAEAIAEERETLLRFLRHEIRT